MSAAEGMRLLSAAGWPQGVSRARPNSRAALVTGGIFAAALLIRELLQRFWPDLPPFMTMYPAVALAAFIGGPVAGSVCAAAGLFAADFLWIEPRFSLRPTRLEDVIGMAIFVAGSASIVFGAAVLRTAMTQAHRAMTMLDDSLAAGQVGTCEIDLRGERVRASASAMAFHGLADGRGQPTLAHWLQHVHPDDIPRVRAALEGIAAGASTCRCDYRVLTAAGTVRWLSLQGKTVPDGGQTRLLCGLVEVTDRVTAQAALQLSEATFRAVLKQIPAAAAIIAAPSAEVVLRSDRSGEILGHAEHRMQSVSDMAQYGAMHPDGRPYGAAEYPITRALLTGEVVEAEPLIYRRPDGNRIDLEVYATPIRDGGNDIIAAAGMAFDVSARRRAEDALRKSREKLDVALTAASLGVWETDLTTGQTLIDQRLAVMLGLAETNSVLSPRAMLALIHPADRARTKREFRAALTEGRAYHDEFRVVGPPDSPGGSARWVTSQGAVQSDGAAFIGIMRDVTSRRRREDELRAALTGREMLIREADHRIKNSLQLVVSLLTVQQRHLTDPQAVRALQTAVARVNAVAASHLALQNSPDLSTIGFGEMLEDLCRHFADLSPDVAVTASAAEDLPLDADRAIPLGLIVSELLTNALRHAYAPGDKGQVEARAAIDGADLIVTIRDDGAGMVPDGSRFGLGSRVVRALVGQIGAQLSIRSQPEHGTSVTIRMPLAPAAGAPAKVRGEAA